MELWFYMGSISSPASTFPYPAIPVQQSRFYVSPIWQSPSGLSTSGSPVYTCPQSGYPRPEVRRLLSPTRLSPSGNPASMCPLYGNPGPVFPRPAVPCILDPNPPIPGVRSVYLVSFCKSLAQSVVFGG